MKVVKVQKEAQEGSDRSCHCSLTSYNTSEVLPLTEHAVSTWKGQGNAAWLSGTEHLKLNYIVFAIGKSACMQIAAAPLIPFHSLTSCRHQGFGHLSGSQCSTGHTYQ